MKLLHVLETTAGDPRTNLPTDSRLDSIAFGCMLALWNNPALDLALGCKADGDEFAQQNRWLFQILEAGHTATKPSVSLGGSIQTRDSRSFRPSRWNRRTKSTLVFLAVNQKLVRWIGPMSQTYLFHMIAYEIVLALFNTRSIPLKLVFVIPLTLIQQVSQHVVCGRDHS